MIEDIAIKIIECIGCVQKHGFRASVNKCDDKEKLYVRVYNTKSSIDMELFVEGCTLYVYYQYEMRTVPLADQLIHEHLIEILLDAAGKLEGST
jgi:hypothetical protein